MQTIYNAVGSKRDVLSRVLDSAAAFEFAPVPLEAEPGRIVAELVEFWRGAYPGSAPLLRVVREAAVGDVEAATLERERTVTQLRRYADVARLLANRGALRTGLSVDHAAAAIFAIGHPETYRTLVLDGHWGDERWAAWAQATLEAALLRP